MRGTDDTFRHGMALMTTRSGNDFLSELEFSHVEFVAVHAAVQFFVVFLSVCKSDREGMLMVNHTQNKTF